jgi:hypothetical protein
VRLIATRKAEQNRAAVDPWTIVHFSAGLALGMIGTPRRLAIGGAVLYELLEQVFERHPPGQAFFDVQGPESLPNAIVDVVVLAAGHRLGEMWNETT